LGGRGETVDAARARRAVSRLRVEARIRVAAWAVLLAIVPTVVGVWAIGRQAEQQEEEIADAALGASLRSARSQFDLIVVDAGRRARALADTPAVQRALVRRDAAALRRLSRANRGVELRGAPEPPAEPLTIRRAVEVRAGDRIVGSVSVPVRLDQSLLAILRRRSGIAADVQLAIARDGAVVAGPRTPAGDVRVVRTPLTRDGRVELLAVTPAEPVRDAAGRIQRRLVAAGIGTLAAIALLAYALAPVLLRARLTQRQGAQAAHVLLHLNDGVALVDEEGVVRAWNPAAETITGIPADDVLGGRAAEVIPGWAHIEDAAPIAARPGTPAHAGAVPVELDGREVWLSVTAAASEEGVVYAFRDLSGERELEGLRSELVATVSHELRTPLASIYGAGLTLRRTDKTLPDDARERLLAMITEQSESLARIVEEMLLASQLAEGRLTVRHERFDAHAIAEAVHEAARLRAGPEHRLELSAPEGRLEVAGDGDKAHQVLSNLVDNAIKYSPAGGVVAIRVEERDGVVRFSVRDEGLGIDLRDQARVFEKFTRLDPQMARGIGGTGLGLYISNELVARMNGRIGVDSSVGEGSTFWFELPMAGGRANPPATTA
jgi:PAS domain S-box-containing protein